MVRVLTVDNLRRHSRRHLMPSSAAALCAAALVALSASSSAVAQVAVPTDDPASGNTTTGVGPLIAEYTDDTTQSSYAEHTCNHDSPALQSAIYGSHSLNETDGLFDGCDARRPYCIKSDGIYRRGYTVVALKSGGSSGDDLILQSGEPYTTVVLAQNYEGDGNSSTSSKGFKGAGVGPLRITVRTDALTTSGKYCTSASGTIPSFAGGTATCDSTTILTDARRSFLLNTLVPKAVAMLTSRLNVNQISGNLLVPSTTVCTSQHVVASSDVTQGIANTDFAIYLTAAPTAAGTIAWGGTCAMDTKNRPIVGMINISPAYMDAGTDANTDHVARVVVHEMMHALGFSGGYISSKMPSNLKSTTRRGEPVSLFTGSKSNGGQQTFFGCSTVDGVEIENEGAVGSSGSHWKRRSYLEDIMSPVAGSTMVISSMTLGYFEDTGNYFPDYTQAEDATWLKGSGCGTFDSTCITTRGGQGKWFCNTNSDPTCTANYKAIGACNIKTYTTTIPSYWQYFSDPAIGGTQGFMGYCPIVTEYSNRLCYDSTTATTNTVQAQYYGTGGRCFTTSATLLAAGWGFGSTNPGPARCMQSRCLDGTQVQFQIGTYTSWISCPADGSVVTLDMADYGYTGTVTCPPAADFCTSDICYGSCTSTSATTASTTSTTTTTTKPTTTTSTTTTTKPTTTTTTSTTTTTKKPTTTTTTTTKPTTTTSTTTTTKPTTTTTTSTTTKKPTTTTTSTTTTKPTTTTTATAKPTTTTTTSTTTQPPATTTTGGKQPASCSSYLLSGTSPSTVLSTAQINLLLKGHNDARQAVKPYAKSMPMLQWDQKLANFAQSYLDTCPGLSYSPVSRRMYSANFSDWWYIGENMAAGPEVKPDNLQGVVDAWVEGGAGYQYPTCVSGWCGAYTQIVWAASTSIGCAYKYCPNDQYQYYWVCNFGVGGNVQGQNPYETTPYVSESAECTSDRYDASTGSASATDACDASYFVSGTSPSTTLSTDTINVILKGHNDLRRDVTPYANTMPMLQWNQKLADFAQSYLSTCPGLANSDAKTRLSNANFPNWWYVGESMAAGEELTPDYVQDVIAAWSATDYFTYPNSCASGGTYVCTTYKQMIWAQTTDIGCAYQYCPNEPYKYYWVCNYGVGGSVQGQAPYANQTDLSQSADCTRARTSSTSAQSRGMNAMGVTHRRSSSAAAVSVIADTLIFSQDTATGVTAEAANGVVMPPTDNSLAAASISSSADALEQPPKTTLKKSLAEKLRAASEKAKAAVGEDAKPGKSQLEL